jgi:hypothetical protein
VGSGQWAAGSGQWAVGSGQLAVGCRMWDVGCMHGRGDVGCGLCSLPDQVAAAGVPYSAPTQRLVVPGSIGRPGHPDAATGTLQPPAHCSHWHTTATGTPSFCGTLTQTCTSWCSVSYATAAPRLPTAPQVADHFNAEVVAGTIAGKQDAVDYLTWTYFFRRLVQNPSYYDLQDTSADSLSAFLSNLVEAALAALQDAGELASTHRAVQGNKGRTTEIK